MTTKNASNGWRWVGLIVLLLTLLLLWKTGHGPDTADACCGTVPVAEEAVVPAPGPASVVNFALKAGNGKLTLSGEVPSETERQAAVKAAAEMFGEGNVVDQLTVKEGASLPGWWHGIGSVMAWARSGNGYGLSQLDNMVTLTGMVAAEADKAVRESDIGAVVGPHLAIDNQIAIETPPVAAAPEVPACSREMHVAVSFATSSADLSADGRAQLEQVAMCITTDTEVGGHTDDTGSEALNNKLSKARADAVVAYITSINAAKGALLTAVGYGASRPVADNATEDGRAQNRRIEFIAK